MISALGRGGTGVTVIDRVFADTGGCGVAPLASFRRSVPRRRTTAKAIPMSRMLEM